LRNLFYEWFMNPCHWIQIFSSGRLKTSIVVLVQKSRESCLAIVIFADCAGFDQ